MPRLLTEVLERIIFWLLVLTLVTKIWMSAYRFRQNNLKIFQRRLEHWQRHPRWIASSVFILLTSIGFFWMGTMTAIQAHRWHSDTKTALQQKILPLDLHIPNVSPDRTYTVVAKFRIHGRPYESSPLHVKFGAKKSSYNLTLHYDAKNPAKNSWVEFQAPGKQDLNRVMDSANGLMFLGILLWEPLEIKLIRRRLAREAEHFL